MIRWKYLGPRLLVVAGIFCFLTYGLDPILRWSIVSTGQTITGAKVDLESVRASLGGGSIALSGLQIADPSRPDRNLVEATELMLDLDMGSLLRRKFEVRTARLTGLKVHAARDSSGALIKPEEEDKPDSDQAQQVTQLLGKLSGSLGESVLDDFETVQLAREMSERWPREYQQLKSRIEATRKRIDELKQLSQPREKNILESAQQYAELAGELDDFRSELSRLEVEIKRLSSQPKQDKAALLEARKRDEVRVRELVQIAKLDKQAISQYVLGPEKAEWVNNVLDWVNWARQFAPAKSEDFRAERSRGRDIVFVGVKQRPDFLIRSMVLTGELPTGNENLHFRGVATGITNQPKYYGLPTVINVETEGRAKMKLCAILDRTNERSMDRFVITCPHIDQHDWVLGDRERIAFVVPAGSLQFKADLRVNGDQLTGGVMINRNAPGLQPIVADDLGGQRVADRLAEALRDTNNIELQVAVSGTTSKPKYQLHTELGNQLAGAFRQVAKAELKQRQEELTARLNHEVERYTAEFQQAITRQQEQLGKQLALNDAEIAELTKLAAERIGVGKNLNLKNLRLDKLFR